MTPSAINVPSDLTRPTESTDIVLEAKATIPDPTTLHLPRILCLHGGGTNSLIFQTQLRAILKHPKLVGRFRFVFADAPFECDAAPAILPIYAKFGTCRRWLRWLPQHEEIEDEQSRKLVLESCERTMAEDDVERGATGPWVAILGFSQGAKVAVSMLYEAQIASEGGWRTRDQVKKNVNWIFAVAIAGRAPFVALSKETERMNWCQNAGQLASTVNLDSASEECMQNPHMKLRMPTIHVHGLHDEGLELHRRLADDYCAPGTVSLVEWQGSHRVPLKKADVNRVVDAIEAIADEYGI